MGEYMSDEEFTKCSTIDIRVMYDIDEELNGKGINNTKKRIEYVKENYGGQIYLYFMFKELDDKIIMDYYQSPEKYLFSRSAVDGLLRSYLFASQYMQDKLPEHAYKYIKNNLSTFVAEIEEQLKDMK